jgi:hypothetical protein
MAPIGGELFRAAPSPKPKLRVAAVARRAVEPYRVLVLEGPQPADDFACLDPCRAEAGLDDAVSFLHAVA